MGPGVEFLTFGHLLSHRSGLSDIGDADEYDNLKQTIATGSPGQNWILPEYAYRNANYALFRLIIAYIDSPLGVAYGHGGSIGGGSDGTYGSGRGARAHSLMLPNNVQIYITINSANNDPSIEDSTARMEALRDSFVESLHPTP